MAIGFTRESFVSPSPSHQAGDTPAYSTVMTHVRLASDSMAVLSSSVSGQNSGLTGEGSMSAHFRSTSTAWSRRAPSATSTRHPDCSAQRPAGRWPVAARGAQDGAVPADDWLRLHDLRHAFATFLLVSGASPRTVLKVLGHSQIGLTMNPYAHVLPEIERAAVDEAAKHLFG
ncbi:tyrosine-type recombinase/integrase [Micromonospora inaquosa]